MNATVPAGGRASVAKSRRNSSNGQRPDLSSVVSGAVTQFVELNGQPADRVSGVRRLDSGWSLLVDVVDVERIPATTSVLSTYRVDTDEQGQLVGYERIRRFTRAATDGAS